MYPKTPVNTYRIGKKNYTVSKKNYKMSQNQGGAFKRLITSIFKNPKYTRVQIITAVSLVVVLLSVGLGVTLSDKSSKTNSTPKSSMEQLSPSYSSDDPNNVVVEVTGGTTPQPLQTVSPDVTATQVAPTAAPSQESTVAPTASPAPTEEVITEDPGETEINETPFIITSGYSGDLVYKLAWQTEEQYKYVLSSLVLNEADSKTFDEANAKYKEFHEEYILKRVDYDARDFNERRECAKAIYEYYIAFLTYEKNNYATVSGRTDGLDSLDAINLELYDTNGILGAINQDMIDNPTQVGLSFVKTFI